MPKDASSFELTLNARPANVTLTRWLYKEMRQAILEGRLSAGARLPATRDFAHQYGVSRGTVVTVFEQLQSEGYLRGHVGAGTWVDELLPGRLRGANRSSTPARNRPEPMNDLTFLHPARPFRLDLPALAQFPLGVWVRVAGRRLRALSYSQLVAGNLRGFLPLRQAIASYLGSARGVKCCADQIVILSGVQQGLDLLARLLLKPGDAVWMEDPGYFGATIAFRNAGAKILPVPVDPQGLSVAAGRRHPERAKGVYLTPAHQFPLGMTMPMQRRLEILAWARESSAFIIEDDYDSEFRFEGRPIPALQGLDDSIIFLGTFNKLLFPSLRLGYAVLPPALVDPFLALRYGTDLRCSGLDQTILCDFITQGHLGRHLRRMRELYAGRLAALVEGGRKYLQGLLDISPIQAGLYTAGFLRNGMTSKEAETLALANKVESMGLHRFTLRSPNASPEGLLLGFAGFDEAQIRHGIVSLAAALDSRKPNGRIEANARRSGRD
jgi:GntR family transcriptional regulator/MocR family aminotransferase